MNKINELAVRMFAFAAAFEQDHSVKIIKEIFNAGIGYSYSLLPLRLNASITIHYTSRNLNTAFRWGEIIMPDAEISFKVSYDHRLEEYDCWKWEERSTGVDLLQLAREVCGR